MAEPSELTGQDTIAAQELTEMIAELEEYRERLVNDTLTIAQKAKIVKSQALAPLEPELNKIDTTLQALRAQQAALTTNN
jgi:archaellum component FlaC